MSIVNDHPTGGGGRRRLAGALAVWALAGVVAQPLFAQESDPSLELVPHPDLTRLAPEARARLEPGVDYFRGQRARLEGRTLGLAYGRIGINYLAHEQYEAAGAALRNARVLDPANPRWPYLLGYLYQQTGKHDQAVTAYRESLRINPSYWQGFARLGQSLLATDRLDEAAASFEVVLERNPDDPSGLLGAGDVAEARGEHRKAISLYQRGLRFDPAASAFHARLATAYAAEGDAAAAAREEAAAGPALPTLEDPLIAFVEAHTRGAAFYREAAAKAEELGNVPMAIRFYDIATSIQPDDTASLLKLGQLQGATGDFDAALATYARVTLFDPDNAAANYYVGTLLERRGNEDEAAEFYAKALETDPQLVEPRMLLANGLMRRGDYDGAGEQYAQIAHQLPSSIEVHYLLGLAWLAGGQCEWSHQVLSRALAMKPGDGQVMTALARAYSTCDGVSDEQRKQALDAATAMYERAPDGVTAETLAMASAANGRFEDAVDLQAQAMFEALKRGDQGEIDWLRQNMSRYEAGQRAVAAWPAGAEVYRPRSLAVPTG
jgi:tetratricopeptide (TPR) repeat protein